MKQKERELMKREMSKTDWSIFFTILELQPVRVKKISSLLNLSIEYTYLRVNRLKELGIVDKITLEDVDNYISKIEWK
jgi:predicted transcriptional regulator